MVLFYSEDSIVPLENSIVPYVKINVGENAVGNKLNGYNDPEPMQSYGKVGIVTLDTKDGLFINPYALHQTTNPQSSNTLTFPQYPALPEGESSDNNSDNNSGNNSGNNNAVNLSGDTKISHMDDVD